MIPPTGWTYFEDRGSPGEGGFLFFALTTETTKGLLTSGGVFAISTWLMPAATDVTPDEILSGFLDGQVTEYASRFGGNPQVSSYTITSIKNSTNTGWSTTFNISGKGGTFVYGWADLRAKGRFVEVICQATPANWEDVSAACGKAAETINIGG